MLPSMEKLMMTAGLIMGVVMGLLDELDCCGVGDWNFDFSVSPYYKYLISKSEKTGKVSYCLSLYSGELQASDNQYIDAEDFIYPFYSLEEIEIFISLFDKQLVDDKFNSKNSKDDLFKD